MIREAAPDDAPLVAVMRSAFLAEHRGVPAVDEAFAERTLAFVAGRHGDGSMRSWLAEDGSGRCVGIVSMLLLELPPLPDDERVHDAYVLNMYVRPSQRGRGVGRRLLDACLAGAAECGVRQVCLRATDDGRPLYAGAGFAPDPDWLGLAVAATGPTPPPVVARDGMARPAVR